MPEIESYYDRVEYESVSHSPNSHSLNFSKPVSVRSGLQFLFATGIFAIGTMLAPAMASTTLGTVSTTVSGQNSGAALLVNANMVKAGVVNTSNVISLSMNSAATNALLVEAQSQSNSRQRRPRSNRQNSNRRGNRSGRRGDRSRGQRGNRRGQRSDRSRGDRQRGDRQRGDRQRGENNQPRRDRGQDRNQDRSDNRRNDNRHSDNRRGGRDRGQRVNDRRRDDRRFNRRDRRRNRDYASGGRRNQRGYQGRRRNHRGHIGHSRHSSYNRSVYGGRKYAHGFTSKRGHGYFCTEHSLFHYFLGFDPVGFSKTSFYGRRGYKYASSCYPVEKVDFYRGRKALIKAVACYDSYDNLYIKRGSSYASEYY